ncbi:hypothetical protein LRP30_28355 [Bradyrhizobium sp. C-145]|uniref:hypothetical protein n=1 Tax=Bradyrhizobium sp. C-145 TaxID=574727 RepID=UPI00201B8199|nr:hypothetical protein [Bradyrhizobium sp. C-145]UQR60885.1 hypothetical protein LRP30_28355 [Bradyrhizobium sp. C-145]
MPYGDVVMVLSIVLRIKRTLDGAEIDKIIWGVETRKALAAEPRRREEWRKAELNACRFRAACDHADAVAVPVLHQIACGKHDIKDRRARRM